jgi:hypothetical protein
MRGFADCYGGVFVLYLVLSMCGVTSFVRILNFVYGDRQPCFRVRCELVNSGSESESISSSYMVCFPHEIKYLRRTISGVRPPGILPVLSIKQHDLPEGAQNSNPLLHILSETTTRPAKHGRSPENVWVASKMQTKIFT